MQLDLGSTSLHVTVSLGGATLHAADTNLAGLLARADDALYTAKQNGRNRVALAPEPVELLPNKQVLPQGAAPLAI